VVPPGWSSSAMPAAANTSRIRSDSAKFFIARAARRASISVSTCESDSKKKRKKKLRLD